MITAADQYKALKGKTLCYSIVKIGPNSLPNFLQIAVWKTSVYRTHDNSLETDVNGGSPLYHC